MSDAPPSFCKSRDKLNPFLQEVDFGLQCSRILGLGLPKALESLVQGPHCLPIVLVLIYLHLWGRGREEGCTLRDV